MTRVCTYCGQEFAQTRGGQKYCSKPCYGMARRGNTHNYKGGSVNCNGYRMISVNGKRMLEHRHIMEQHLGRSLLPTEVVHHKDHNRLNNAIENLEVKSSPAEHAASHYTGFRSATHKQCRKCKQIKPRTEFDAGSKRGQGDPNHTECKTCRSTYYAARYLAGKTSYHRRRAEGWHPTRLIWGQGHIPPVCITCGTDERSHKAAGQCERCYAHAYYLRSKAR